MTNRCTGPILVGACLGSWEGVRWPKALRQSWITVYYEPLTIFSSDAQKQIKDAMLHIQNKTSWHIQFEESTSAPNRIYFTQTAGDGCWSRLGMIGGKQQLNLQPGSQTQGTCQTKGIAIHELMHALGAMHEHSRPDRNNYITVNSSNLTTKGKQQLEFQYWDRDVDQKTSYDLGSIMHYEQTTKDTSFVIDKKLPMFDVKGSIPAGVVIGQRDGLSVLDAAVLNLRYQ